jgi:hypothetical protein
MEEVTVVAGIPIPSTSPWFLGGVAIHVAMGLVCVVTGIGAMLSRKGRGRHSRYGTVYFWFLLGVFVTATGLAIVRWDEDWHLFVLGVFSFATALIARQVLRQDPTSRSRRQIHVVGMASSYILLLTAFYVDNGKSLPIWKDLPTITYWLAPAAVGLPLLLYVLLRHPLLRPSQGRRS